MYSLVPRDAGLLFSISWRKLRNNLFLESTNKTEPEPGRERERVFYPKLRPCLPFRQPFLFLTAVKEVRILEYGEAGRIPPRRRCSLSSAFCIIFPVSYGSKARSGVNYLFLFPRFANVQCFDTLSLVCA